MKTLLFAAAATLMAVPAAADHHEKADADKDSNYEASMAYNNPFEEDPDPTPVRSAGGYVVMSEDAVTPSGFDGADDAAANEVMARLRTMEYPECGPNQTDRCVQPNSY